MGKRSPELCVGAFREERLVRRIADSAAQHNAGTQHPQDLEETRDQLSLNSVPFLDSEPVRLWWATWWGLRKLQYSAKLTLTLFSFLENIVSNTSVLENHPLCDVTKGNSLKFRGGHYLAGSISQCPKKLWCNPRLKGFVKVVIDNIGIWEINIKKER